MASITQTNAVSITLTQEEFLKHFEQIKVILNIDYLRTPYEVQEETVKKYLPYFKTHKPVEFIGELTLEFVRIYDTIFGQVVTFMFCYADDYEDNYLYEFSALRRDVESFCKIEKPAQKKVIVIKSKNHKED